MAFKMMHFAGVFLAATIASPAFAAGWEMQAASPSGNALLRYKGNDQASYLFECTPDAIVLTETGVTDLLDLRTNTKIGDTPGSVMTSGAAMMALTTDLNGVPNLLAASAVPNSSRGWDLTIRLGKKDKALRAMARAQMISVFTTGYTMAVGLDETDRATVKAFLTQCGVKI